MARLLNPTSNPCAPSSICIFDTPDSQIAFQKGTWLTYVPAFNADDNGPFTFHVHDSTHFLQLSKTYISFRLKLEHVKLKVTDDTEPVAPTNFVGCSFFNQVKVAFNNVQLYDSSHYAYKAYVQTLLGTKSDHRKGILSAAGWVDDDESIDNGSAENVGFKTRVKSFKKGELDICAPVLLEPFSTEKLLVPHVNMQLTFYRNNDSFVLQSGKDTNIKLSVQNMRLHMRAIEVTPSAALAIENKLRLTPAKYPYTSIKVKVLPVQAGRLDLPYTVLYHDIIPRKILIGLMDPEAMEGKMTKNPFSFNHNYISELTIDAGGVLYPAQPIQMDFENKNYARAFVSLFEELGCVSEDKCPSISYKGFANGHCFFAVNLSPLDSSNSWELLKSGTTQLTMKFSKKTPTTGLNVVVFSFYDNQFCIDSYRNVYNENQL